MLVLQAFPHRELGLLMLKPGTKLLESFVEELGSNRVVVMPLPESFVNVPSGKLNQPIQATKSSSLVDDDRLIAFFNHPEVRKRLGNGFNFWMNQIQHCQLGDGTYCDKNLTITECAGGAVRSCWHHDNEARRSQGKKSEQLAKRNVLLWALSAVASQLGLGIQHALTPAELCWWAVRHEVYPHLPDAFLDDVFKREEAHKRVGLGAKRSTNARYAEPVSDLVERLAKPVKKLEVDAEPPAMFMARPKANTWKSEAYLKFVRSLPCCVTGRKGSDLDPVVAHHLIGHGEGKMGGKAHDLFTMPMLASEHQKFHHDPKAWEQQYGSQLEYVKATIKKALDMGAVE
ncbi:DUF968 domain-containing protein [Photobacterium sp. 1_MG-2023]|uniref:DUF968 domain-containing protein n=1 Tax=Photobacterium sp. 1_MG-2023 TaxID=3062646 RepID=UPI0026E3C79B|nr:DUF968 domain-containing protein [Photobacterium sp. 1_MG-2023]MDO6707951.1 DUF968 domain-containing protein [Photobacterium sp. 1_MG-2023]